VRGWHFYWELIMINEFAVKDIKCRAERGETTNQDCLDLIEYIGDNITSEEFLKRVETAVDEAFDQVKFDSADIVSRIIERVKK